MLPLAARKLLLYGYRHVCKMLNANKDELELELELAYVYTAHHGVFTK
jgi:hypothetical protein